MEATLFTIRDRSRMLAADFANPTHFTLDEGQLVDPKLLIEEPGWTPYCLDDENHRVFFVQIPPEVDLSQAAFVYSTQFEQAQRALVVPYAILEPLTQTLEIPKTLILIYSIGRCGTTLMSQILNRIDGVYSLSEPDLYTNASMVRKSDRCRDGELAQVLKACTLLLCSRSTHLHPTRVALKFRSGALELSDLMQEVFPNARNLFMYRNAVSWAQSVFRFLQRLGIPNQLPREDALKLWAAVNSADPSYLEPYMDVRAEIISFTDLLAPAWTSYLDRYMAHYERGVPFHTVRYEDLNNQRETTLNAAFDYCGLPASALERAMQAFDADSQAGTAISRDIHADDLTEPQTEQFLQVLSRHPRFNRPDFVLPDHRDDPKRS